MYVDMWPSYLYVPISVSILLGGFLPDFAAWLCKFVPIHLH